jgi:hypothetical protein
MHLTHRACNGLALGLFAIVATLSSAIFAQTRDSGTLMLDLTQPVPREEQLTGFPGASVGGIGGVGRIPPYYTLPLAVDLRSISAQAIKGREKFHVEVLLKNTSNSSLFLPASQLHASILKQGNRGRRTMLFSLVLEDSQEGRNLSFIVGLSDGSETVPGSFLRLEPGQTVRVLLASGLNSVDEQDTLSQWVKDGVKEVKVRAQVKEWTYEDRRYFIENRSAPVTSNNTVMLEIASPD